MRNRCLMKSYLRHCRGADDATIQWFNDNGFTVSKKLGTALNEDGVRKQYEYRMEKK